ncbi:MAG: DUF1989 domain-containing protein [Gammaproteobacteria bacterium]|nr:DUF1989 domain-containing protein [Gammaproteobacteria bacterium]
MPSNAFLLEERIPAGCHHALLLKRGYALRLTDLSGDGNVGLLAFNADERSERYNMADTLKAQHTHKLALGNVLYSDMGRPLLSIMGDSFGWHDTICGTTNAAMIEATYGLNDFQLARNGYYRNGRDGFLMELGRWGLGRRDLVPNANFFSTVTVDDEGNIGLSEASYQPGAWVELRAELNVLVILSTAPHPLREGPAAARTSEASRMPKPGLPYRTEARRHEHATATGNHSRRRPLHGPHQRRAAGAPRGYGRQ